MGCQDREREQGFLLVGLIVVIFLILLAMSVAAPKVGRELRREREVETVHRGNQYVRAIQLYYRKFGHYPGSMEQLTKSNDMRFLRQDYVDPMTGKSDWRLIKVGENKTTVKGFFGQPLAGLPAAGSGLGSAGGSPGGASSTMGSPATGTAGASSTGFSLGGSSSTSPTSTMGSSGSSTGFSLGGSSSTTPASGTPAGANPAGGTNPAAGSNAPGGLTSSFGATGGGAPFVGVGLVKEGDSIITLNEQTTYNTWEFIYDPRIEQLKAKAAMLGGGATGTGLGGNNNSSGSSIFGGNNNSTGFGGSNNNSGGFGSGFGGSTSPTSNGGGSTPAPPATPPQ